MKSSVTVVLATSYIDWPLSQQPVQFWTAHLETALVGVTF